jgi:hypothetical protein
MASNIKLAVATRNALGDALISAIGSAGLLKIYDGTQPAGPGTAVSTQTLLGTLTCASPFGSAASSGVVTAGSITQDSAADATGTASWYRLTTSGGTAIIDGTIGTSGADLNLNTTSIVIGGPISVSSFTYTMPGG